MTPNEPRRGIGPRVGRGAALVLVILNAACGGDPASPPPVIGPARSPLAIVLDSIRAVNNLPALGAAIVTSGGLRELATVGVRRFGTSIGVSDDDRWHLGSTLKHQVAVLSARLVSEGRLSGDKTLAEYFPELAATMRSEYRDVRLRDLLSHTAAMPRDYSTGIADARSARAAVVDWAVRQPPVVTRGTYAYSNVHFMVAAAIMERVTGTAFETLILDEVWKPLGITTAGFGAPGTPGANDQPLGHFVDANGARTIFPPDAPNADNPVEYGPAGRAHMSLRDWGRFVSALLSAEQGRDTPVLTAAQWRQLTAAPVVAIGGGSGYGYGLVIADRTWAGGRALFHDGSNTRNYALVGVAPGRDFAILIVSNQYSASMGAIMDATFGRLASYHLQGR